jgi:hypothetical protein
MQVVNTGSSRPILQAQFTPCLWNTTSHIRGIPADSRGVTNENTYKGDLARLGYDLGDARHEEMHALHVACGQEQFSYLAGKCRCTMGTARYLSRLRPSDRESVPLRLLATDYSLLATYYSCFWKGGTPGPIRMRAAAFLVRGSEDI